MKLKAEELREKLSTLEKINEHTGLRWSLHAKYGSFEVNLDGGLATVSESNLENEHGKWHVELSIGKDPCDVAYSEFGQTPESAWDRLRSMLSPAWLAWLDAQKTQEFIRTDHVHPPATRGPFASFARDRVPGPLPPAGWTWSTLEQLIRERDEFRERAIHAEAYLRAANITLSEQRESLRVATKDTEDQKARTSMTDEKVRLANERMLTNTVPL